MPGAFTSSYGGPENTAPRCHRRLASSGTTSSTTKPSSWNTYRTNGAAIKTTRVCGSCPGLALLQLRYVQPSSPFVQLEASTIIVQSHHVYWVITTHLQVNQPITRKLIFRNRCLLLPLLEVQFQNRTGKTSYIKIEIEVVFLRHPDN